ncbi:hypothetical protein ARMSODRAFT_954809 [Armillaria solidipes]|uniref:Uncharacterized protein n=1 Tax=Armillaria solidipes TaxID=1076256 RepID=A0A2H3C787_9AGAR|nr:hypothetical protein ARMSODRAFT_954809 [Armillaria solidipes]
MADTVLVLDFLKDVVNEPRADAFGVSSAFEDIVDGIECFRLYARPDHEMDEGHSGYIPRRGVKASGSTVRI